MVNDQIAKKLESIQKEFQQLGNQISELASMSTQRLEEYRDQAMIDVKQVTKDISQETKKQMRDADEYAHNDPWAVIAGASIVGFLIGVLFSKKK